MPLRKATGIWDETNKKRRIPEQGSLERSEEHKPRNRAAILFVFRDAAKATRPRGSRGVTAKKRRIPEQRIIF